MSDDRRQRLFKLGLIGPTQVGKTSLITSLLTDGQRLLEGGPVTFTAADTCRCRKPVPPGRMLRWSLAVQPRGDCVGVG
jgi:hypothetical protein